MKTLKYSIYSLVCTLFVSCMGAGYADPDIDEIPFGNNELAETNVVTIAQLKSDYATLINNSNMKEITEDIQIKGIVTGNDAGGNLYRMIPVDDGTGAINVGIDMNGLCREMKVGQEVLISLKGLMIGGNSQQPQVGGIYTNTTPSSANYGKQSVGSMNRYVWETHHKLIGLPDPTRVAPEEFDITKVGNENYMKENCGKLMTIKGVSFRDADGKAVFAPDDMKDAANGVDRALKEVNSRNLVVRVSTYANFANVTLPTDTLDITGIFNRYRDKWQILVRDINDVTTHVEKDNAIYRETFGEGQGDFKLVNVVMNDPLTYVWAWDSRYGMKATAYVGGSNHASESWLVSPAIDLSNVNNATLMFDHARRYGETEHLSVLYSTSHDGGDKIDASQWTKLEIPSSMWPDGSSWDFITAKASLKALAGKKIYIAFRYTSTDTAAATWEVKNFVIE